MLKRIALSSCLVLLAGAASPALAADIDQIIYAPELPTTQMVEVGSGWYLRGDIGYSLQSKGAATSYNVFDAGPPASYTATAFDSSDLTSDFSGAIGFGYAFTDYFRSDLTVDFSRGRFDGSSSAAGDCVGGTPANTTCSSTGRQDFESYGFMANGYVDLGTVVGFTPYLGAGAGITRVKWDDLNSTNRCVDLGGACGTTETAQAGADSWRFTYALMAGMSYDISESLKLDLGYRYQKTASGPMFQYDAATALAGASGAQARDNGFEKHEVRVGLRYELW
ncbi:opacity protein-like surface antigen [Hoeflea marina]|uniref:Opacity protein-like surface antigen n=1 Tax=Hoeflea marina TaxID=274592 RepID=A0A317PDE3_9HYPH|nr:outer membrane protein [Hoeflea marina]PWV95510.1 opacity protein-like surface antigen [Hoeflea marina]